MKQNDVLGHIVGILLLIVFCAMVWVRLNSLMDEHFNHESSNIQESVLIMPDPIVDVEAFTNTIHEMENFKKQLDCMTLNLYREAGNQTRKGMVAVAQVVMNRVEHSRWPNTPCDVIYQRNSRGCQFSWVCQKRLHHVTIRDSRSLDAWNMANEVALEALVGELDNVVGKADHYHATYVSPSWRHSMSYVGKVGVHVFYKN